jgi:formate hydrogenlyase subunit 6/NADH:ubiquinone oxidoreductase subunit I
MWFESYSKLNHKGSLDPSNYRVALTQETCIGCGLCVKRCPMDALHLEESDIANNKTGKVAAVDIERCIGCGVCAHKCPSKSLVLQRCEKTYDPPESIMEFGMRFISEKNAVREDA